MSDAIIFNDFKAIEAAANRTPRGADHAKIVSTLAIKYDKPIDEIRRIIIDNTISGPC